MFDTNFKSVMQVSKAFEDVQVCINYLEKMRWNGEVISPFNPDSKIYKCKNNKYKCKLTGKYFNVRTGTMFDSSNVPLQKWFMAIWIITSHKKGISSVQLALDINVTQKTAWFLNQRIRNCFGMDEENTNLTGTIEADETFVGGKNKNRHAIKKVSNSQGRSTVDKTAVLGLLQRKVIEITERPHKVISGKIVKEIRVISPSIIYSKVMQDTKKESIQPIVKSVVLKDSKLMTDEHTGYTGLNSLYDHEYICHGANEYVNLENNLIHTNTIEGFWSTMKRGYIGIYHFMSRKHLQKYVDEFSFRYNTVTISATERFNKLLKQSNKRLTYKMLIS